MKKQRRHELQTNVLADYLGKHLQQIKPYYTHITFGVVLVAVLCVGAIYYMNKQWSRSGVSWGDYFDAFGARDARALEEVGKIHGGTTAALWAQQAAGDIKLATGAGLLYSDREEAEDSLKDAEDLFLAVEAGAAGDPMLVQRARMGLAQVYESLFKVERAQEYYEKVAESAPDSAFGKMAQRRIAQLSDPSLQRWYAWFERQEPVAPGGATGSAGDGPSVSDDLDTLPDRPNLSFPSSEISDALKDMRPDPSQPAEAPMETPSEDEAAEPKSASATEEDNPADATDAESEAEPATEETKPEPKESKPEPKESEPVAEESKAEPSAKEAEPGEAGKGGDDEPASKPDTDSAEADKQP